MMNRISHFINKEKLSKTRVWANEHALIRYVLVFLTIAYVLATYKTQFMAWYDNNIIPIIGLFISNIWIVLLTFILIVIAICDIVKRYRARYQYDVKVILSLFFVSIVLIVCRLSGDYDYVNWIWFISYVDVLSFFCITYDIAAIVNKFRLYYDLYKSKSKESVSSKESILNDWPIEHKEDDIFDLEDEAIKLAERIKILNRNKAWSLAITAPWGTGKTSFLNLIMEHISEKDFEVVRFIPRDSKSFKTIQEDFFTSIACVLSKYDSRCSNTLKDYMASLQLIDNRDLVEKVTNFYHIWNKDSLKDSIKQSFASLNKKVLVLIDDFDRLSKDEILEVLKLIDSNAAFTNMVFLTAYDKKQVNESLGDSYKTKDACFVDKFFNLEFAIPSRPYSYISMYIEDKLCEILDASNDEKKQIHRTIAKQLSLFEDYIPTLRDAKRYLNQFILDFKQVRGDVMIDEYLLVQLIKYRNPECYKSLYKKEYLEKGSILSGDTEMLYLKKDLDASPNILSILKLLFPTEGESSVQSYRHIYSVPSFDNYFVNQVFASLRIKDMQELFQFDWDDVIKRISEWIKDGKSKDLIDYLVSKDNYKFESFELYLRYVEIIAYYACILPTSSAYWLFFRNIYNQNLDDINNRYHFSLIDYKSRLINLIKKYDSKLTLMADIHMRYKTFSRNEDDYLIKDNDIWPYLKNSFIQAASIDDTDEQWLLNMLYLCIDSMEEETRKLILDSDCLNVYRKRLEEKPSYYINNFVRLAMISSSSDFNTVACDPFWPQIFGDDSQFENFVNECRGRKIEKADLVSNFWQLFKANDFNPIEFQNQGNVQEKIDNNLVEEVRKLEEMRLIEDKVSQIPQIIDSVSKEEKEQYKQLLINKKNELDNIKLYISFTGSLKRLIDEKLRILE